MKKSKYKILSLILLGLLVQSSCAYAASTKSDDLDNITPGFEQEDIQKSYDRVNSFKNTFTGSQTETDTKTKSTQKTQSTTDTQSTSESTLENIIVSTQESTGIKGDFWGLTEDGKWVLIEKGNPVVGWKMVKGNWYYMDANGIMQTGWLNDNGTWYYLQYSGAMAVNTVIDGYVINSDGVCIL